MSPTLPTRAWIRARGIVPLVAVATVGVIFAVALMPGLTTATRAGAVVAIAAAGVLVGGGLMARFGAEAMHRRVADARGAWARQQAWRVVPDGDADAADVALALPRSWRVVAARGRVERSVDGRDVRAETWVLRPLPGSRRGTERREMVRLDCPTRPGRFAVSNALTIDPLTIMPSWFRARPPSGEPEWADQVRRLVTSRREVLFAVSIGGGRLIVLALDDPRPESIVRRADLLREIAEIVSR